MPLALKLNVLCREEFCGRTEGCKSSLPIAIDSSSGIRFMKTVCLALFLSCSWLGISAGRQDSPNGMPIIRLEKSRFVLGERIFFWEGVEQTSRAPIPKKYQETCRRTITRPDGTQKTGNVGWPMDGPPSSGGLGGAVLKEDKV